MSRKSKYQRSGGTSAKGTCQMCGTRFSYIKYDPNWIEIYCSRCLSESMGRSRRRVQDLIERLW